MTERRKKLLILIAVFFGLSGLAIWQGTRAINAETASDYPVGASREEAKLVAVTFASAWCGPCKILKPRLAKLQQRIDSSSVRFVEFDFTFGQQAEFVTFAADERVSAAYESYRKATGFTLIVNPQSGAVLDVLTADYSVEAMQRAVDRALALVAQDA